MNTKVKELYTVVFGSLLIAYISAFAFVVNTEPNTNTDFGDKVSYLQSSPIV